MEVKKIAVCGDSFCSGPKHQRTHFSQILEDRYGYAVVNLARGGASTVNVGYQIQTAITLAPDAVVYAYSFGARIDVPVSDRKFIPGLGLKNFVYPNPSELSYGSPHVGGIGSTIVSNTVGTLAHSIFWKEQLFFDLPEERQEAIRQYLIYLHDENLRTETDQWIAEYWELKLAQANIQSIPFSTVGQEAYEFNKRKPTYPEIYHTDYATQEIVAKNIHDKIEQK